MCLLQIAVGIFFRDVKYRVVMVIESLDEISGCIVSLILSCSVPIVILRTLSHDRGYQSAPVGYVCG